MEESLERKVLVIMVALWLDKRLKATIHGREGRIPGALGIDGRVTRKTILAVLGEVSEELAMPSAKCGTDHEAAAKVIIASWLEEQLYELKREMGRVSKAKGIHAYTATDFIRSLLGEVSEALGAAYDFEQKAGATDQGDPQI